MPVELRVSETTEPNKLGGAIVKYIEEDGSVTMSAMGAHAVNQAVKGIIRAQSYVASNAKELVWKAGFRNKSDEVTGKEITLIMFFITTA